MHPILFTVFGLEIKAYGFFIAIGFLVGINLAAYFAKKEGIDPEKVYDLSLYILISAILGARILEVLINHEYYFSHPKEIIAIWNGGLTFYGGLIAALAVCLVYLRKQKNGFWQFADIMAPSLAIGYMFGRIGCFFAGCCYGKPVAAGSLCLTFTNPQSFAPKGVCLYPTQLYGALAALIIFIILLIMRRYHSFRGQLMLGFILLYAPARFFIEFFRNDSRGVYFGNTISTSQLIGIPFFIGALILYFYFRKTKPLK